MISRLMAGPWITDIERKIVADALTEESWYEKRYYYVEKFEKEFAEHHDRRYGLMTTNCTQAIYLILFALRIKEGDEIIVPDCTWTGSVAAVPFFGAKPVFCDVEADTWCLDPISVEKNLTEKTKAIIAVDLYGNMPKMEKLNEISKKYNVPIIEDSAEALGSKYKGIRAGKFGVGSVFSFHSTKTITSGEGGILLLDNDELYKRAKFIRDCGRDEKEPYVVTENSLKHMPSNPQAALVYAQFTRLAEIINKKREIFFKYKKLLGGLGIRLNIEDEDTYNGVWATSIVWDKKYKITKEGMMRQLEKLNLPSRPFFYPLSSLPAYSKYGTGSKEKNPISYDLSSRGITLPGALILKEEDLLEYCKGVKQILTAHL